MSRWRSVHLCMGVCAFLLKQVAEFPLIFYQYLITFTTFLFFSKRPKKLCLLSWVTCVQTIILISSVSPTVCVCGSRASWCPLRRSTYVMPRSLSTWSHRLEVPHLTPFCSPVLHYVFNYIMYLITYVSGKLKVNVQYIHAYSKNCMFICFIPSSNRCTYSRAVDINRNFNALLFFQLKFVIWPSVTLMA